MGVWFTASDEIYITFYVKWPTDYVFNDGGQEKMLHTQYNQVGYSPW
jgi:hypothetical protein